METVGFTKRSIAYTVPITKAYVINHVCLKETRASVNVVKRALGIPFPEKGTDIVVLQN